jgi:hypothetical protein
LQPHQFSVAVTAPAPVLEGSPAESPLAPLVDVFPKMRLFEIVNTLPFAASSVPTVMPPPVLVAEFDAMFAPVTVVVASAL